MSTSIYPFNLGEHQAFVLHDSSRIHTAEELIVNPNLEELEGLGQEFGFIPDAIRVDYNNLLIQAGDHNILVDAGLHRSVGNLRSGLEELKIDAGDIQTIIITHSDRDHIWGLLDEGGEIAFPEASYIILESSWRYWTSEESSRELARLNRWREENAQFAWETYSKIRDRIRTVQPGEAFIPGFRMYPALGHRYDHSILKVTASDRQLVHLADALAHPLFMVKPDWYSTYDANPPQAIETKMKLLNACASENALVFGAHFPFPGLGTVQQEGERWKWQPVSDKK
jgi:glyoxylase-like metal-dependent hydrolase (beta-lactamase superfamily II)